MHKGLEKIPCKFDMDWYIYYVVSQSPLFFPAGSAQGDIINARDDHLFNQEGIVYEEICFC